MDLLHQMFHYRRRLHCFLFYAGDHNRRLVITFNNGIVVSNVGNTEHTGVAYSKIVMLGVAVGPTASPQCAYART